MKLYELFSPDELFEDLLAEASPRWKKVVRKGKVVRKRTCPAGYRLKGNRCVKQSQSEKNKRRKSAKKSNRTGKAQRKRTLRKSRRLRRRRKL